MSFTITVGEPIVSGGLYDVGMDAAHYTQFFTQSNPCIIACSLTDISARVRFEVASTKYKFATFSLSGISWTLKSIESSWHTSGSTAEQTISVSGGALACAAGDYVGLVLEVPANSSLSEGIGTSALSGDGFYDIGTSYATSGSGTVIGWRTYIYAEGEYSHSNSDPIPHTSSDTTEVEIDGIYANYGAIQLTDIDCIGTYQALFNVQTPWGSTYNSLVLESGETTTYSRSTGAGTEYYKIEVVLIDCTNKDVKFREYWWEDDGKRYVKTTGSDSKFGTNWGEAWKTAGYGFQNIPNGKDLYVEEGLYGGETLSNLNPPQTMKMNIQPSTHDENPCKVWVSDNDSFTAGSLGGSFGHLNTSYYTYMFLSLTSPNTGRLRAFDFVAETVSNGYYKLKVFRDDGTNYVFIGESENFQVVSPGTYRYAPCDIAVIAGDIIGISGTGWVSARGGGLVSPYKVGDITTTTLKSSWSTDTSFLPNYIIHGFE